jgi:hypothetical protein
LLALHGNVFTDGSIEPYGGRGPQFYTHCFNIDVTGNGNAVPKGVRFPGGYKQADPGVSFQLYDQKKFPWTGYVIPGPPKYAGKYDAPAGSPPIMGDKDRGQFPPEFEAKYKAFKTKWDAFALSSAKVQNQNTPQPKEGDPARNPASMPKIPSDPNKPFDLTTTTNQIFEGLKKSGSVGEFFKTHLEEGKLMPIELAALKAEGRKLGVVS